MPAFIDWESQFEILSIVSSSELCVCIHFLKCTLCSKILARDRNHTKRSCCEFRSALRSFVCFKFTIFHRFWRIRFKLTARLTINKRWIQIDFESTGGWSAVACSQSASDYRFKIAGRVWMKTTFSLNLRLWPASRTDNDPDDFRRLRTLQINRANSFAIND